MSGAREVKEEAVGGAFEPVEVGAHPFDLSMRTGDLVAAGGAGDGGGGVIDRDRVHGSCSSGQAGRAGDADRLETGGVSDWSTRRTRSLGRAARRCGGADEQESGGGGAGDDETGAADEPGAGEPGDAEAAEEREDRPGAAGDAGGGAEAEDAEAVVGCLVLVIGRPWW